MFLKTQNGKLIINLDHARRIKLSTNGLSILLFDDCDRRKEPTFANLLVEDIDGIGKYETQERTKEVFDEICKSIFYRENYYKMPES